MMSNFGMTSRNRPHNGIDFGEGGSTINSGLPQDTRGMNRINTKSNVPEVLTRTSWVDALTGYKSIKKGKAVGNLCALWIRWKVQRQLESLGHFIQKHSGKVLFVGLLLLSLCCVGLKTVTIETNVEKLWVEDGGRLQEELAYTKKVLGEGYGSSNELVIQTGTGVLTKKGMLRHLKALYAATKVTVEVFDKTWKFTDLCIKTEFPSFDEGYSIDMILESILPCVIITPLDCFWEGSKLLGPEHSIIVPNYGAVKWTNLNPKEMLKALEDIGSFTSIPIDAVEELLHRSGVTTGYQEKWCLDPTDPECPVTAPNKYSQQEVDVGAEMTGGCRGYATKYMQWEEDLIVGGVKKNKTNHIVKAEALQSIIQLMGESNFYDFHRDTLKTRNIDWTQETAKTVLEAWQRKFTEEVQHTMDVKNVTEDDVYAFSSTSLLDLLHEFSNISHLKVSIGYLLMLVYACLSLLNWNNPVHSQSGVGVCGVLLVALSVAAGLGICSVIGISFNASTTQIIPFLALGLGVDDMFLLAYSFGEISTRNSIPYMEQTGECLKRTGVSVLLTSISNAVAFFSAAIVPIPALRSFALQAAILIVFNLATILLVFPAVVSLDLYRRQENRVDVFCCFTSESGSQKSLRNITSSSASSTPSTSTTTVNTTRSSNNGGCDGSCSRSRQQNNHQASATVSTAPVVESRFNANEQYRGMSPPPPYSHNYVGQDPEKHQTVTQTDSNGGRPETILAPPKYDVAPPTHRQHFNNIVSPEVSISQPSSTTSSRQCLTPDAESLSCYDHCLAAKHEWNLTTFATRVYAPLLEKTHVKIFILVAFVVLLGFGIMGTVRVKNGLDLTDVVPRDTTEYKFLEAQSKYFAFYNFFAITKDIDYPKQQNVLYDYHTAFQKVENIIKKEDGALPHFWLQLMKDWLMDVQKTFDTELKEHRLDTHGWFQNASEEAILGYKLMVQTGDRDDYFDKSRIHQGRVVDRDGIIYPPAFYNYLTAWTSNDALAYASSQAYFHPVPKEWYHSLDAVDGHHTAVETDLQILKSQPIVYAQLPFYLHNMAETEVVTDTIVQIRDICESYEERGLLNFPSGIPFTFWEQYINLRFYLMLSLICVLGGIFVVLTVILMNPWMAVIVVSVLAMVVVELFGMMGLAGIKLSAVPAVILIVSVGISVEFTVHISLGYLTCIGSRNKRTQESISHMFAPVVHGSVSTFLGVVMLAAAEFDFIKKYFFVVLSALILIGTLNGLVLLPVLLSMLGPPAEVTPADGSDVLAPPTPEPSPKPRRKPPTRAVRRVYPKTLQVPSDISLSTITEEPSQYSSHEITVHPELVVETTTTPGASSTHFLSGSSSYSDDSETSSSSSASTPPPVRHVTTKVRARATVKVEVHTPLPSTVDYGYKTNYKNRRRKSRESTSSSSQHREKERGGTKETSFTDIDLESHSNC